MLKPEENELLTRTGPGTPMGRLFRAFWVPAMTIEEVGEPDGPPVRVGLLGEELLAFRATDGQIGIVDAYCAHRRAPLFYGRNERGGLRCSYHGWKYDMTGQCVDMPNAPATSRFHEKVKLKAYPTREAGGLVWAYMGPEDEPPPMPQLEWLDVPNSHYLVHKSLVECNYLQAAEGDHDSSHTSHLHSTLDNRHQDAFRRESSKLTEVHLQDKAPRLNLVDTGGGFVTGSRRQGQGNTDYWRMTTWLMPFYSLIASEPGTTLVINVRVPITDELSWLYRVAYHPELPLAERERAYYQHLGATFQKTDANFRPIANLDNDYLIDRIRQKHETFSGIPTIPDQDRSVTERMAPVAGRAGTVDRSTERLGPSDAAIIRLRRMLLQLAREYEKGVVPEPVLRPELYRVRAPALQLPKGIPFDIGAAEFMTVGSWGRHNAHARVD